MARPSCIAPECMFLEMLHPLRLFSGLKALVYGVYTPLSPSLRAFHLTFMAHSLEVDPAGESFYIAILALEVPETFS